MSRQDNTINGEPVRVRVPDPDGKLLYLPGRQSELPPVYLVDSHPLLEHVSDQVHAIYVVLIDKSPSAMKKSFDFATELVLPEGTDEGIESAGMYFFLIIQLVSNHNHRLPPSRTW